MNCRVRIIGIRSWKTTRRSSVKVIIATIATVSHLTIPTGVPCTHFTFYSFDALYVHIIRLFFLSCSCGFDCACDDVSAKNSTKIGSGTKHQRAGMRLHAKTKKRNSYERRKCSALCNNVNTWCCKHGYVGASVSVTAKSFCWMSKKRKKRKRAKTKKMGKYFVVVVEDRSAHPRSLSFKIIITWLLLPIFVQLIAHTNIENWTHTLTSNDAENSAYLAEFPIFFLFHFYFGDG